MHFEAAHWPTNTALTHYVERLSAMSLEAYRANPLLVEEHTNLERSVAQGSYGRRQIYELVQNGADALLTQPGGRVHVLLTERFLYCANEGAPIDEQGVGALLHSHLSVKRRNEIGRFGLGFKSVLGVTAQPEFYCRSGSFAFNAARAAEAIKAIVPSAEKFPVLRLAHAQDAAASAAADPILSDLMSWATTVVRLEWNKQRASWLADDIRTFPSEFLLFCPHVGEVILEDRTVSLVRNIRITPDGDLHRLTDGQETQTWKVFHRTHHPTVQARAEAGELADREELPVIWAVPVEGRLAVGRFWAFFPLADETTLSGILNAPWKTNDDRTSLLNGAFNAELLDVVAQLVIDSLPNLTRASDPAWHLDVMPARGREARCWADEHLTYKTYALAARSPSLPDQSGRLRAPSDVRLHPDDVPREVVELWGAQPDRPNDWCHASTETRERRPRAVRLMDAAQQAISSVPDWLAALAPDAVPQKMIGAIRVAAALHLQAESLRREIRASWILLDDAGNRIQPVPGRVFLPGDHRVESASISLVHPALLTDEDVRNALGTLGITEVSPELELESVAAIGTARWDAPDWDRFWSLVRRCDQERAVQILRGETLETQRVSGGVELRIKVRTVSGAFQPLAHTILPGAVVPDDSTRDADVAIDTRFHQHELPVLLGLGAVGSPTAARGLSEGEVFRVYHHECALRYLDSLPQRSSRPDFDYLVFSEQGFAGPLEPITRLCAEGNAAFTSALLKADSEPTPWSMRHRTRHEYASLSCEPPAIWAAKRYGRLTTSLGPVAIRDAVAPALAEWQEIFPVADCSERTAIALSLPSTLDALRKEHWTKALERTSNVCHDELLGKFYGIAVSRIDAAPSAIQCRVGQLYKSLAPAEVTVVSLINEFRALQKIEKPVLLVGSKETEALLVDRWQCHPADRNVRTQLFHIPATDAVPLGDQFPGLRFRLKPDAEELSLISCAELRQETLTEQGKTSEPREFCRDGRMIYWLERLGLPELLERLDRELKLDLAPEDRDAILRQKADHERRKLVVAIRRERTEAAKLLLAVGHENIRPRLPHGLVQAVEAVHGPMDGLKLAELALVVFGVSALQEFREELGRLGLQPPQRWAGSRQAVRFVAELGFSRAYAGFEETRREAVLFVDGPCRLPDLHDYQTAITRSIRSLLTAAADDRRGLLSLPTGAGKTRVAVQALVGALTNDELVSPVLWVAQSDELCEQAVQTWREVWRALGLDRPLQISRFWASNDAEDPGNEPHVVVATIQKLSNCFADESFAWLSKASVLVIDEAHGAVAPTYTQLLTWLGIERKSTRCPLIGLTATPFRGRSAEETDRLAGRFGRTRLDPDLGDDPYLHLQNIGVLSRVEHRLLPGTQVTLTGAELEELKKMSRVPTSVYDRIAGDVDRNQILLRDIASLPRDWPVLVFAASVEHAQTIAALLAMEKVTAAPISATTEPGARREYIEKFKTGKIQVLANYNVLTQGFDAPATRAIYVARPTFSPNVYQQMIGRGLRGPRNGGKEKCLIVNVEDNFAQYGEKLAFQDFEYLWKNNC